VPRAGRSVVVARKDITAPILDNETWAQCLTCGRTRRVQTVPGLLWTTIRACWRCEHRMQISGTFPALNTPRKPSRKPKAPKPPKK
jgi:hypothetical protein